MSVTRPSDVLRTVAGLIEAATPYHQVGPHDVFRWVPTMGELEEAPDRAFVLRDVSLDPVNELSCLRWDLGLTVEVSYSDHPAAYDNTGGSAARIAEDARTLELALRGVRNQAWADDYEAVSSSTDQVGSAITHTRVIRVRYVEGG